MVNPSSTPNAARPRDYALAVIVAAILIILAGMVIPFLRSREMARDEERARLDLIDVRDAIRAFMRDVGLPPTRDKDGNDRALLRLCGPGRPPQGAYFVNDACEGEYVDHLYRNEPLGKANSPGYAHWSGPYLKRLEYDPWYRAYTVVAYPLNPRDGFGDGRVCIVVCAGPNGRMDGDYSSPRDPVAAGDDLIEVVTPDGPDSVGK
jgi:type II secretory pathway pseudopilin PulG